MDNNTKLVIQAMVAGTMATKMLILMTMMMMKNCPPTTIPKIATAHNHLMQRI